MNINTSSNFRKCFIAPQGYKMVGGDFSQIEPRLTAHYASTLISQPERSPLHQVFSKKLDLYASIANEVLGLGLSEDCLSKEYFSKHHDKERQFAKILQLAITYGMGASKLARSLSTKLNEKKTYLDAKHYLGMFWERFWDVKNLINRAHQEVLEKGYVDTIMGRKKYISKSKSLNKIFNYKIQCSASDLTLFLQLYVDYEANKKGIDKILVLPQHDEMQYYVKEDQASEFAELFHDTMVNGIKKYRPDIQLKINLELDVKIGDNWGQSH